MDKIKKILFDKGASLVGFADLRDLPEKVRFNLNYGISIGIRLNPKIIEGIQEGPNKQYQEEHLRINQLLDQIAFTTEEFLKNKSYQAIALTATVKGVNNYNLSTLLPHKTVATKAGLGWIGKCALLITKEFGSAIRLATVLTNMVLNEDKPVEYSFCGKCQSCQKVCPVNAIVGKNWKKGMKRDQIYDAFSCQKAIKEMVEKIRIKELICSRCIIACPWTKKYIAKSKKISY